MTVFLFDRCELNSRRRQLLRDGQIVTLQPLVFELLLLFVSQPGRVIHREEMLRAAWRSQTVSASVVARAVMKLRRAIGDDAAQPRLLSTVARIGYRFDAAVSIGFQATNSPHEALGAEASAWRYALLPPQVPADAPVWLRGGLQALAHHLLSQRLGWVLAPLSDVEEISRGVSEPQQDDLARACHLLGAEQTLAWELKPIAQGWLLRQWRGRQRVDAVLTEMQGRDPVRLMRQQMAALCGQPWHGDGREELEAEQHERLAESLGQPQAPALQLQQLGLLPPDAWLLLRMAELQNAKAQPEVATQTLAAALQRPEAALGSAARVHLLLQLARLARERMDLPRVAEYCHQAQEASQGVAGVQALLPELLELEAGMRRAAGEREAAIALAERALASALITGSQLLEARARVQLAHLLMLLEENPRCVDIARLAISQAQQLGVPALEMRAGSLLMLQAMGQRQFQSAAALARRTQQLAATCGDLQAGDMARILELMVLAYGDYVAEAEQAALLRQAEVQPRYRISAAVGIAVLRWKQGQEQLALQQLDEVLQLDGSPWRLALSSVQHVRGLMLLSCGQLDAGRAVLRSVIELMGGRGDTAAHCAAALALAECDFDAARRCLAEGLPEAPGSGMSEMDNRLCLAWLLLEAEASGQPDPELDRLAAGLLDYAPEFLPARLFAAAYLLRRAPSAATRARWDRVVATAAPLLRRHSWITKPAFRDALVACQATRLPELLTQACL